MTRHRFADQRHLGRRLGGAAGRAIERGAEAEANRAAVDAITLARRAVEMAEAGELAEALATLAAAGSLAEDVLLAAQWRWLEKRPGGRAA